MVVEKTCLEWGRAPLYPECTARYSRSEDGRRDTVRSDCSLGVVSVREYDAENKLLAVYLASGDGSNPFVLHQTFEYDAKGRLTGKTDHSLQKTYTYDYSTLVYTNRGYISGDAAHELDAEGRLIRLQVNPSSCFVRVATDAYDGSESDCYYVLKDRAALSDEEKLRMVANETTWSYFEDGYAQYYMRAVGNNDNYTLYNRQKTEYHTREQERGYSTEKRVYIMFNEADSEWVLKDHSETVYYFREAEAKSDVSSPGVEAITRKVYGVAGALEVETANAETEEVTVWSASGRLVRRVTVRLSGHIPLAKGFYIVKAGRDSYKVFVR
ncbi:MAG: hypothetical protein LBP50_05710 [Tannerella sp.]|nr:hypothetical protein [Tannerella sp.]